MKHWLKETERERERERERVAAPETPILPYYPSSLNDSKGLRKRHAAPGAPISLISSEVQISKCSID